MKIGASIMLSYDGTYHDFLNYAVSMKFDWVEFKYDPPFMLDRHLSKVSREQIRQIAKENDIGLSLHAPYYETNLGSLNSHIHRGSIESCLEAVHFAADIGCSYLTIHCGDVADNLASAPSAAELAFHRTLQALKVIQSQARKHNLELAIENRNGSSKGKKKIGILPQELLKISSELEDEVGFTLDIGHANVSGISTADFALALGKKIRLMHVHDNDGHSDQHKAVGTGTVDFPRLLELYRDNGWSFPWVVECKALSSTVSSIERLRSLRNENGKPS